MAYNPAIGSIYHLYTTYILPSGGLYNPYHRLGEPETTIDFNCNSLKVKPLGKGPKFCLDIMFIHLHQHSTKALQKRKVLTLSNHNCKKQQTLMIKCLGCAGDI